MNNLPRPRLRHLCRAVCILVVATIAVSASKDLAGQQPLRERIDGQIDRANQGLARPIAEDLVFLRRVSLDLVGSAPSRDEMAAFLAEPAEDRREKWVERLLADPRFDYHMANLLDVTLMERRPDKHIKAPEWQAYLLKSVQTRKPLNQLAREIMLADCENEELRAASKFYLDREGELNLITRDLGRVFFGVDLQCAQCHDHPHIDSYTQDDYYGLFAFVNRSFVFTDKDKKVHFAEKAEGDVSYTSVFTGEEGATLPRLMGGDVVVEPEFAEGEEYIVKPEKDVRPVPKYSRREQLSARATDGSSRAFNENMANRLWAHMIGKGLVHPVDLAHDDNPASDPELLQALGEGLVELNFDLRAFLREIALTRVYQRAYDLPGQLVNELDPSTTARQQLAARIPELDAQLSGLDGEIDHWKQQWEAGDERISPLESKLDELRASIPQLNERLNAVNQEKLAVDAAVKLSTEQLSAVSNAVAKIQEALDAVGEDADLKSAADLFAARQQQLQQQLSAQQADQTAKNATFQEAKTNRDQAVRSEQEVLAQWKPIKDELIHIESEMKRLRGQRETVLIEKRRTEANITRLDDQIAVAKAQQQLAELVAEQAQTAADINRGQEELGKLTNEREQLAVQTAQARTNLVAMESQLATTVAAHQQLTDQSTKVDAAVVAAEQAYRKLSEEEQLAQIVQTLVARQNEYKRRLAEHQSKLSADQAVVEKASEQVEALSQSLAGVDQRMSAVNISLDQWRNKLPVLEARRVELTANVEQATDQLVAAGEASLTLASLRPLSPEQLAWSMMEVTGVTANQRAAVGAELEKNSPMTDEQKNDPAAVAARDAEIEAGVREKLQGTVTQFVRLFANAGGQPQDVFFATVEQALYFRNNGQLRSWIAGGGASVRARALALEDINARVDEIYLSVLTRKPLDHERQYAQQFFAGRDQDKDAAIQEFVWGLMTSDEFRFNQ